MILSDQKIINLYNHKVRSSKALIKLDDIEGMIFNKMCLGSITVNPFIFKNIQFLALKNNFLSDISFLKHLPNIYFFDISQNSIEDLEPLNIKSTFGYLHLTLGQFNDKKLLSLKGMTIGVFEVEMQDYSLFTPFLISNPNIIVLNKEIVYFSDKFLPQHDEIRHSTKIKSLAVQKSIKPKDQFLTSDIIPLNNSSSINPCEVNEHSSTNKEINKLLQFYNHYNNDLYSIISQLQYPTSNILSANQTYKDMERMKLKLLANAYGHINQLINKRETFLIYKGQVSDIHLFDFSILLVKEIKNQLIILILLLLYMLQMITKELAIITLNYILKHFNGISDDQLLHNDSFADCHLLGIYYHLYDNFIESFSKRKELQQKDNNKTLSYHNIKYDEIIKNLKMETLILKGNFLLKITKEANRNKSTNNSSNKKNNNLSIETELKRLSVKWKCVILKQLNIAEPILFLMQFLCDYIYSSKIGSILSNAFFDDYVSLNETRDYLYKLSSEKLCLTLSEKKFQQNKLSHLNNRLFLSKEHSSNKDKLNLNEETILTNKRTKFYINTHQSNKKQNDGIFVDNSNINKNTCKSIFDHLHLINRKKKPKLTLEIEDYMNDEEKKNEEIDPTLYLNIKKVTQSSTKHSYNSDIALNNYHFTNKTISSFLLPKVNLKDTTTSITAILTPNSKTNSQIELWRNYQSNANHLKYSNVRLFNERATETAVRNISKSLNTPITATMQHHHKTYSDKFRINTKTISQSKDITNNDFKSRNGATSLTSNEMLSSTTTMLNFFVNSYHPILTKSKLTNKKDNKNKVRRVKPFLTNIELKSLFTIRKYNEDKLIKKQNKE